MKLCPPSLRRVLPPRRCQVQSKDPQRLTPSGVAPRWLGLVERLGKFKPFLCTTYTIKQLWPIECFDEFVVSHVRVSGLIIPSIRSKPLLVYVYIYISNRFYYFPISAKTPCTNKIQFQHVSTISDTGWLIMVTLSTNETSQHHSEWHISVNPPLANPKSDQANPLRTWQYEASWGDG